MKNFPNRKTRIKAHPKLSQSIGAGLVLGLLNLATGWSQDHWIIRDFAGPDGAGPSSLILSAGTFFGTTSSGGDFNRGTVFRLNTNGSDFTVLKHFTGGDGGSPWGNLALAGATLYGTASSGGISNYGTVFKLRTDGGDFSVLKQFVGSDGVEPRGLIIINTTLYGTTFHGGISNRGTIFKVNTDGSEFTMLKEFTDPEDGGVGSVDGCLPSGCLTYSGTNLYGTTMYGGTFGRGVVFKLNLNGAGYTVLQQGSLTDGGHFFLGVIWDSDTLYGATAMGPGGLGLGTVFRLNPDGSGFTNLALLTGFNGTAASSLVASGARLYGSAFQGGQSNAGVVFMLAPGSSQLVPIKQFQNFDGSFPRGLVSSTAALYGVTGYGGSANCGTVFGLALLPPAILQPPDSQTAEAGGSVKFSTKAEGTSPLAYEWFFEDTNFLSDSAKAFLKLTNVQSAQAGNYTVVVTNLFGSATSPPAALNVIVPVARTSVPGLKLSGEIGSVLHLDYANDLSLAPTWLPLAAVNLTSTSQFYFDLAAPRPWQRFYRAWQAGTPGTIPTLALYQIPTLTLLGNLGETVRVDGINVIGSPDAWFPLDTVTLTNSPQLYFDTAALGNPARLYRLVPEP